LRGTPRRSGDAGDAGGHRSDQGSRAGQGRPAADRRPLLRGDDGPVHRPRRPGGDGRRPDRAGPRRRRDRARHGGAHPGPAGGRRRARPPEGRLVGAGTQAQPRGAGEVREARRHRRARRGVRLSVTDPLPPDWTSWRDRFDVDGYEERWQRLAAAGVDPHGEVALVQTYEPRSVLDAGCGTGRVAIELAHRGVAVVGIDNDPDMVDVARAKAPELRWIVADLADLAELALPDRFDVVVLAGNVIPYIEADRRAAAVD